MEFLEEHRLKGLAKKHSELIDSPIELHVMKTKKVKKTILQSITINNPSGTIGYESLSQIQEAVKFMADAVDYAQNVR